MNMITKILMALSALVIILGLGVSAYFSFQYNQEKHPFSSSDFGVALEGYDIISYFAENKAQKGDEKYQVEAYGSRWYFSSLAHQQDFIRDGDLFLPEYGGYDPYGIAISAITRKSNPQIWTMREGKLYLFFSFETQRLWLDNYPENLARSDLNWPTLERKLNYIEERK